MEIKMVANKGKMLMWINKGKKMIVEFDQDMGEVKKYDYQTIQDKYGSIEKFIGSRKRIWGYEIKK